MADAEVVVLEQVSRRFSRNGPWVLDGVDLAAGQGSVTSVVGGNGSGKSTLLRIVAGVSRPTRGRVAVRRAGRTGGVGFAPERPPGVPRMTAAEYLGHLGRLRGLDRATVTRHAAALFERLRLSPGPDVPVGSLSKGNAQKVALAQAFLPRAALVVLDEPFGGLDTAAATEVAGLVREARQAGAAVVMSTHVTGAAAGADAEYHLARGRLRAVAPGPHAAGTAAMWLVLAAVADGVPVRDLAALPGVRSVDPDPVRREVTVCTDDADGLLRHALHRGWSLRSAQPAEGPAGAGRVPDGGTWR